jgi:hypothetical protein
MVRIVVALAVIPAKAGIQLLISASSGTDPGVRRGDDQYAGVTINTPG